MVDSSVWIEFLRGTDSAAHLYVRDALLTSPNAVGITEPIAVELLAGPTTAHALTKISQLVESLTLIRLDPNLDFAAAASLHRAARQTGRTVRKMNDCLIAAVAIRHELTLVHRDADFDTIASISSLKTRSFAPTA
ncbi:ribonuclease [Knoellia sinensis KCTC 19936]|uniref:Ribonuclease VapC n=1 Tax=Knoellia sinensis KCTC 19936 TaxID=1385520 RepID=A0A0A0J6V5_9MICO|nr:ribonuclease [Knoellia sinensis KCTC 19936]